MTRVGYSIFEHPEALKYYVIKFPTASYMSTMLQHSQNHVISGMNLLVGLNSRFTALGVAFRL